MVRSLDLIKINGFQLVKNFSTYIKEALDKQEFHEGDIAYFIGNDEYAKGPCEILVVGLKTDENKWNYRIRLRDNRFWVTQDYIQSTPGGNKKQPEKKMATIRWYNKGKFGEREISNIKEYDDFITDNVFRDFLIDHGCYDDYIKNVEKIKPDYKDRMKNDDRREYLNHCFSWDYTDKPSFWEKLNDVWKRFLRG